MTSLTQLAQELIEKSKNATPGPWEFSGSIDQRRGHIHCPDSRRDPVACYGPDTHTMPRAMVETYEYIAACSPDAIQSLCQAFLEAREILSEVATNRVSFYTPDGPMAYETRETIQSCKAREFLAKYGEKK